LTFCTNSLNVNFEKLSFFFFFKFFAFLLCQYVKQNVLWTSLKTTRTRSSLFLCVIYWQGYCNTNLVKYNSIYSIYGHHSNTKIILNDLIDWIETSNSGYLYFLIHKISLPYEWTNICGWNREAIKIHEIHFKLYLVYYYACISNWFKV
jgi:hypothetical protein